LSGSSSLDKEVIGGSGEIQERSVEIQIGELSKTADKDMVSGENS
jgi:hypothetical protein